MSGGEVAKPDDIKALMAQEEGTLSKPQLVTLVRFYREQASRLLGSTPFGKQRVVQNVVADRVLSALLQPDGTVSPESPLERLLEAANGFTHTAYCPNEDCTSYSKAVPCPDCGTVAKMEGGPNWQAAARVLDYAVPKATQNIEQLQDEFLAHVLQQVMDAYDVANTIKGDAAARRSVFAGALRERLS